MTHRKNVIAFDEEDNLQTIVDTMLEEGNSRYPVFRETIDNIVGIIHYKDALKFLTRNSWAKFKPLKDLPGLIREASFIPETRGIGDLFQIHADEENSYGSGSGRVWTDFRNCLNGRYSGGNRRRYSG